MVCERNRSHVGTAPSLEPAYRNAAVIPPPLSDRHTSGYIFHKEMRTVGFIGFQIAAVKRGDRCEPIRKRARRGQAGVATHTIAWRSSWSWFGGRGGCQTL
jgi:hypothetical protein